MSNLTAAPTRVVGANGPSVKGFDELDDSDYQKLVKTVKAMTSSSPTERLMMLKDKPYHWFLLESGPATTIYNNQAQYYVNMVKRAEKLTALMQSLADKVNRGDFKSLGMNYQLRVLVIDADPAPVNGTKYQAFLIGRYTGGTDQPAYNLIDPDKTCSCGHQARLHSFLEGKLQRCILTCTCDEFKD